MASAVSSPADVSGKLLDVKTVASILSCSPRHVYRLSDSGRMPGPVKLGALVRWNQAALDEWIAAGCPSCRQNAELTTWLAAGRDRPVASRNGADYAAP